MRRLLLTIAVLSFCAGCAQAQDPQLEKVRKAVAKNLPMIAAEDVKPSPVPGIYEVRKGQAIGYVTADGKYLFQGDLVNLETGELVTEQGRMADRLAVLEELGVENMIEFGPRDAKHVVTVYTDIDCGYCRKLHREMSDFNSKGIRVRYLFYPRSGPGTPSFHKAESVWCAADRHKALTDAKQGLPVPDNRSCKNPVQAHYDAGERLGINATPMIILPDGELVRGYVPASVLASRLGAEKNEQAKR